MDKRLWVLAAIFPCLVALGVILLNLRPQTEEVPSPMTAKMRIATSFYPLYYFTKTIVGDDAAVYNLTPAGAEPHDYEPTPQDIVRLHNSRIVIVNGVVEPWVGKVRDELIAKDVVLIQASDGLMSHQMTDENNHAVSDPHIWLSPRVAQQVIERIERAVVAADPAHAGGYHLRAESLKQRLVELDTQFKQGLQGCKQNQFITAHSAFGYLAAEYGLTQIGIAGLSPEAEPSPQALGEITRFAKQYEIKYIFFESLINPRLANTLAQEVGAQTLVLNPLEGLTPEEVSKGKDYFTEMQSNLTNLRLALACPTQPPTK